MIILKLLRKLTLFAFGGGLYVGLELLWRRRSHWSMFLAGGLCFLLVGKLRKLPILFRGVAGAAVITGVELGIGLAVNREYQVWDYRRLPMNFRGQICLPYSLLWMPLSLAAGWLYGRLESDSRGGASPSSVLCV